MLLVVQYFTSKSIMIRELQHLLEMNTRDSSEMIILNK